MHQGIPQVRPHPRSSQDSIISATTLAYEITQFPVLSIIGYFSLKNDLSFTE
jgi:hypothetical protein